MATVKEVARAAGVSVGTVHNVLAATKPVSDALRRSVEQAVRKLGYQPNHVARSLKTNQTHTLAMVISDITNPFFPEMVRGAEDMAREHGYMLATFNTDDQVDRERQVLRMIASRRVDGVLLVVALPRGRLDHVKALIESGVPVVCLDRRVAALGVDAVTVDNTGGVRAAVEHLVEQGARRIAYLGGNSRFHIARERFEGYRQALAARGLTYDAKLVREGDFRRESGRIEGGRLLSRNPDALFSANMLMAFGAMDAMAARGLTAPRDLLLATFDRPSLLPAFGPRLTTVTQPSYQIGSQGASLLLDRIRKPKRETADVVLPAVLEIGETSVR